MPSHFPRVALLMYSLLSLTGCGSSSDASCYGVCEARDATECSDIELSTCYNLCDAFNAAQEDCAAANEALSACQLEQTWRCTDFGPQTVAPAACTTEQDAQEATCILAQPAETDISN